MHSSIAGFRDQLRRAGSPLYKVLRESLKKGSFVHMDETGWNVNGDNYWNWKMSNKKVCVTHIDKSRGQTLERNSRIELAYTPEANRWNGTTRLQLVVQDLKTS